MQRMLGIIPHNGVRSLREAEPRPSTPHPFCFPEHPHRRLVRPFSTLTTQIIGLQGETGVTDSCQMAEAQLCTLALTT